MVGQGVDLASLLGLPGVVEERKPASNDPHEDWPALAKVVSEALAKLHRMRVDEGRAMADELLGLGRAIGERLETVASRGPDVVEAYQKRITERVQAPGPGPGGRDRARAPDPRGRHLRRAGDIAEEVTRLRAHLVQYAEVIAEPESAGRKLEFVVQEMGRETNTIGSKANDVEISRGVVEIKGHLEKIRELIQNVE